MPNEPCVPVGQANWGRKKWGRAILAVSLLPQLDKPTGGNTLLGEQKQLAEKSCQYRIFNCPALAPAAQIWNKVSAIWQAPEVQFAR